MHLQPIATIRSPYQERFGTPRQPRLTQAQGWLEPLPEFSGAELFEGLEGFSHLWLIYQFHANPRSGWQPRVRPPRLGGNDKIGVFATRSPYRPNPLGLSLVALLAIEPWQSGVRLKLGGLDLVDGSPVFDIKPYVPYTDAIPDAQAGFVDGAPEAKLVARFSPDAEAQLVATVEPHGLRVLIEETLALDPRPSYKAAGPDSKVYGTKLGDHDVKWRVDEGFVEVLEIRPLAPGRS